jgi:hypothetical protein
MGQRENRQEKHGSLFPNKSLGKWNALREVLKQKHYSKVLFSNVTSFTSFATLYSKGMSR